MILVIRSARCVQTAGVSLIETFPTLGDSCIVQRHISVLVTCDVLEMRSIFHEASPLEGTELRPQIPGERSIELYGCSSVGLYAIANQSSLILHRGNKL